MGFYRSIGVSPSKYFAINSIFFTYLFVSASAIRIKTASRGKTVVAHIRIELTIEFFGFKEIHFISES